MGEGKLKKKLERPKTLSSVPSLIHPEFIHPSFIQSNTFYITVHLAMFYFKNKDSIYLTTLLNHWYNMLSLFLLLGSCDLSF